MHGDGSSASTTGKHVLLHRHSSTRLVPLRGRGIWIVSMWHRIGKRGRAGTDEHWILRTLLIYSFERRALESKTSLNNDTLTTGDLEGCAGTRRTSSQPRDPAWSTGKLENSHGPSLTDLPMTKRRLHILQVYFTELEIQVKVIIQILSALELESRR